MALTETFVEAPWGDSFYLPNASNYKKRFVIYPVRAVVGCKKFGRDEMMRVFVVHPGRHPEVHE